MSSQNILSTVGEWSDFIMRGSPWALWRKQTEGGEQEQGGQSGDPALVEASSDGVVAAEGLR